MFEVDLSETEIVQTFLTYGDTRSGKTRFSATFPRPLFLADATERGWETIANMSDDAFFEPGVKPIVWGIKEMNDMSQALGSIGSTQVAGRIDPLIASGRVKTIVISSITFYADLFLNGTIANMTKYDPRAAYGALGNHLRDLRVKAHSKGVNVVWEALAKHPEPAQFDKEGQLTQAATAGGPMIPGQQGDKFAAGVQALWYFRKTYNNGEKNPPTFEIRTQPYGKYVAGNRLGDRADSLPNPMSGNYSDYLRLIGVDPDEVRAKLPPLPADGPKIVTKAPSVPPAARKVITTPAVRTVNNGKA